MKDHWKIEDLEWDKLDKSAVNEDLLKIVKAAALVEYRSAEYTEYLCKVFSDDKQAKEDFDRWEKEEVQHGLALGTWAEKIDPEWNLEKAYERFCEGYTPEHFLDGSTESVRGSKSGEMIARCMVETGTSSYYSAIGDSCEEPVLKQICKHIAADEFNHYKLFYDTLNRYLEKEGMGRFKRLRIALGRIAESEDDELSYAFYAANTDAQEPYDRQFYNQEYMRRAYGYYRPKHLDRAIAMIFKACGFKPHTMPYRLATRLAWWRIDSETRKMQKMAEAA